MSRRITTFAILVSLLAFSPSPAPCQSKALEDRFVAEARKAWDAYRERAQRLQGSFSLTTTMHQPWQEVTRMAWEFKQAPQCALYLVQRFDPDSGGRADVNYPKGGMLQVANEDYSFTLKRTARGSPWTIASVDTSSEHGALGDARKGVDTWSTKPVSFAWSFPGPAPSPEAAGFHIKRASLALREGAELVKVEFAYRPQGNPSPRVPVVVEGWVLLDAANYWIIREDELQITLRNTKQGPWRVAHTYAYKQAEGNFPILTSIVGRSKIPDTSYDAESIYRFDLRLADAPQSDFTMSAFGFPEPVGTARGYPWYLVVGVTGLALVVLAVLLRAWAKRRKTA